jgi:FKBP-type peptidyl-prolyl cis-trans isomerase
MLNKREWIAVVIALVVVIVFLGSKFITQVNGPSNGTINPAANPEENVNVATSATTNTNNNMNQNTNDAASTGSLIIKDVVVGTGAEAKNGNLVSVQYTGKFADGKVFDSSIPSGQPIEFTLGAQRVIPGWDQGILGMKVGGKRTLTIPPALGYGAAGYPPVIPPNSTLYFDVELVGVKVQ